jgi:hypothetical protein
MAKNKETKNKKAFPNQLRLKPAMLKYKFVGQNGRFGLTDKPWKDFTFDEMVEFASCHNKATVDHHFTGVIPPNYVSPFDEAKLPVKPTNSTDDKEVND